jgi:IPT/TIG domain
MASFRMPVSVSPRRISGNRRFGRLACLAVVAVLVTTGGLAVSQGVARATVPAPTAPFTQCPTIGADTSCALLIDATSGGTSVLQDTTQGPYDSTEDTMIGVINQTTAPITSLALSSTSQPLFGLDGDGICTFTPFASAPATSTVSDDKGGTNCPYGTTGYEGPDTSFSGISPDQMSGTLNFSPALAPGKSTYFSLEEPLSPSQIVVGPGGGCPPTVKHVFPIGNPKSEIVRVLITGSCLSGATHVMFGSLAATSFSVGYGGNITASPPQQPAGKVDVTVTTPSGTSAVNPPGDQYTYYLPVVTQVLPNHGSVSGGNTVLIHGFMFSGTPAPTVSFGTGNPSASVVVLNDGTIRALVPPHTSGTVDVQVTAFTGTSLPTGADHYTYK